MKKFYFNGCSHTRGDELQDITQSRWSRVVCNYFQAKETNVALGGGSNNRVMRRLFEDLNTTHYDHVFIMWTHPERFELFDTYNLNFGEFLEEPNRPYVPIKLNRVMFDRGNFDRISSTPEGNIFKNKSLRLALEHYYDTIHDQFHQQLALFTHIFQAQQFLSARKIPHTMSFAFQQNFRLLGVDHIKNIQKETEITKLINQIDWNQFIEHGKLSYMYWAEKNKYPKGCNEHPLEEANLRWGQKVIKHILDSNNAN